MSKSKEITDRDNALFEAGIKLGALYHQFTGSPVNLKTVNSLEEAIAKSISVQPFVQDIKVSINREMISSKLNSEFGYTELEGRMLDVELNVAYKSTKAKVALRYDSQLEYPLMRIEEVE